MSTGNLIFVGAACLALAACDSGNDAREASRGEGRETASGAFGETGSGGSYSVREDGEETTLTVATDGENGDVQIRSGGSAGAYLPDFAPLYPGAEIDPDAAGAAAGMMSAPGGAFSQNMGVEGDGFEGGMVSFSSDDEAADIVAFYRARARDAGLEVENIMDTGSMHVFAASHAGTGRTLQVMVFPGHSGSGSQAMLIAGRQAP
ncbi:hypothetical protein KCG44_13730 [Pacificimonas sp. WHA3]|uniref:Lipoprotein n=1 Tax=Pacificimonas pallii TaxID=2827236 RepID=A0ABS6SHN0_9SPHN|nr:hypothetical protein [Pacificimonas pallii]MBV7257841.1 hypothetical protein [Pacificimonas pallii]